MMHNRPAAGEEEDAADHHERDCFFAFVLLCRLCLYLCEAPRRVLLLHNTSREIDRELLASSLGGIVSYRVNYDNCCSHVYTGSCSKDCLQRDGIRNGKRTASKWRECM